MTSNSGPLHQAECPTKSYCNSYFPYEDGTDSVMRCQHIKFSCQGITQKKEYYIVYMSSIHLTYHKWGQ